MPAVSANETNTPNRTEHWWLSTEDGERLLDVTEDTKIPNAATVRITKQDHTLANMIRGQLLANSEVLFAGYKVPHPLEPYFLLKIQTTARSTPVVALRQACTSLLATVTKVKEQLKAEKARVDLEVRTGGTIGAGGSMGVGSGGGVSSASLVGQAGAYDVGGWGNGPSGVQEVGYMGDMDF
ncbi:RNA polymerase, subunit L [Phaffia rhodozyma]|uniref:RNA polymerase, subunit L n=1 Tax=Phaffia rhodozyma TaxID=264483 RepID=A0A0F7SWW8_PHARH|nr:RNA polymerase, subunit L [Phaffia rhodozyma]